MQRPTGVTILAVLAIIGGVLALIGGIGVMALGGAAAAGGAGAVGGLAIIGGIILLVAGAVNLAFGIGAWTLKPWAWTLGVAAQGLSLLVVVLNVVGGSPIGGQIVSIVISGIILYYLFTPTVKQAFGRA
jgi:hypothetical protein